MKKCFIYILAILPYLVFGQVDNTKNNIHTISYTVPVQEANLTSILEANKIQQVTYYDQLGRPMQSISVNAGGNLEEVVNHFEYDIVGREAKKYLPYATNATNNLGYIPSASTAIAPYYQTKYPTDFQNGVNPYSESVFEKSPSSNVLNQGAPGSDWKVTNDNNDHTVKTEYKTNIDYDVLNFDVQFTGGDYLQPQLVYKDYYKKNQLFVLITKNENWKVSDGKLNTTETYKDKSGKVILVRTFDMVSGVVTPHNMYSVYDDFGNVTFVISPKAAETFNASLVSLTNFSQNLKFSELINNTSGLPVDPNTTVATLSLTGTNTLSINYNVILSSGRSFKTGQTALITTPVPNCILGNITNGIYNFEISILNNYLIVTDIAGVAIPRGTVINNSLSINLPTGSVLAPLPTGLLDKLCYQYRYDDRNRLVEKKVPGKDTESVVYDYLNRPILTQDANLKTNSKWLFTKFDVFGRPAYQGEFANVSLRSALQTSVDAIVNPVLFESRTATTFSNGGAVVNYTNTAYPTTSLNLLSIKYYDDYNYDRGGLTVPTTPIYSVPLTSNNKGLATGTRDRVLETTNWETTLIGYEDKARAIWTATKNDYLTTTQTVEVQYDFVGNVLETKTVHSNTSATIANLTTYDYFTYDHYLRPLKHTQKIGANDIELISYNNYDDLGKLVQKKVGGADAATYTAATGLQTVDYSFNVRGWLTKINDQAAMGTDLFAFEIKYNNPVAGFTPLYNGNISQTQWKTANTDTALKRYNYTYDGLNRLKEAKFFSTVGVTTTENTHNEAMSYDKNGNITSLKRTGYKNDGTTWDEWLDFINYTYDANSNKLLAVTDDGNKIDGFKDVTATTDFTYDNNGNLITDANKTITSITYNHFNQPKKITFTGLNKFIEFVYTASGTKISKKVTNGGNITTTFYAGNYIYEKVGSTTTLQAFSHPEGYVAVTAGTYKYVYQYKDNVGNIRLSYAKNASNVVTIVEENNYYPFGVKHKGYNTVVNSLGNGVANRFKFNGQESEVFNGLNITEMDFRQYDAAIGRFNCIDLMAEATPMTTPYHFALNNPIIASDPTGLLPRYEYNGGDYQMDNPNQGGGGSAISRFGNSRYGYRHMRMTNSGMGWGPGSGYGYLFGHPGGINVGVGFGILREFGGSNTKRVNAVGGHWLITTTKSYSMSLDFNKWKGFDHVNELGEIGISVSRTKTWVGHTQDNGSDLDNWLSNTGTAFGMFANWSTGTGARDKVFIGGNVANAMKNANRVNQARSFYYNKYKEVNNLKGTSVEGFKGSFGLSGLFNAGLDPIEQYVGTYRINIYNLDGQSLWFILTNQTSMNSFLYDLGPSYSRSTFGPGGNTNQTYMWNEPIIR